MEPVPSWLLAAVAAAGVTAFAFDVVPIKRVEAPPTLAPALTTPISPPL